MSDVLTTKEFTFTWRIENFLSCYQKNKQCIASPVFKTECLQGSKWRLLVYPRGVDMEAKDYLSCYLENIHLDVEKIRLDYSIEVLHTDEETLEFVHGVGEFEKGNSLGWNMILKNEKLCEAMNDYYEDILTIRCCMAEVGQNSKLVTGCEARTQIGLDKCSFRWTVKYPNSSDWSETKELDFSTTSQLQVKLSVLQDNILINITKEDDFANGCQSVKCKMKLLDVKGKVVKSVSSAHLFDTVGNNSQWEFPPFITKSYLNNNKNTIIKNDAFTFLCALTVSSGIQSEEIEKYTHNFLNIRSSTDMFVDSLPSLQTDWYKIFMNMKHSDVKIKTSDNNELVAHKSVLCARSPVFSKMFDQDMTESQTGIVPVADVDSVTFKLLLEFMYTARLDTMNSDKVLKLLLAAEKYQVETLKEKCATFLVPSLSNTNVCEILIIADKINHGKLRSSAIDFIRIHANRILNSSEWKMLKSKNAELEAEVLQNLMHNLF